jgi:hypothetical protein
VNDLDLASDLAGYRRHPGDRCSAIASGTRSWALRLFSRINRGQRRREAVYLGYEDLGGEGGGE